MRTKNENEAKLCPIAIAWGGNFGNVPYCDDCYVQNSGEQATCEQAIEKIMRRTEESNREYEKEMAEQEKRNKRIMAGELVVIYDAIITEENQ